MKKAHTKRLSIPCYFVQTEKQKELVEKKKCSRLQSDRNSSTSPISTGQSKIKKLRQGLKSFTRHHSPHQSLSITLSLHDKKLSMKEKKIAKNSPPRGTIKSKVPSHTIKKKKIPKKPLKPQEKLTILDGKPVKHAPKIFENQIFLDIYDDLGQHDRIIEIQETLNSENPETPIIIYDNLEYPSLEDSNPRPPGNSFLETSQDSHNILSGKGNCELFAKLELMAKKQYKV
ncbi:hypothetical protein SteCoe_15961 [Stentor coeruleus]|uniref:Uncharacterized protein n=1 Tax=Stentor coeruleus TaxID=5963 RepID=A0A1R2BUD3_9CILI|nr:hypothetical protein SteCoe_19414 [Stentor coeruleus]OMJ83182.1 hypothetical protein SteCoe_15961 [Stentor coeruleus]